MNTVTKPLLTN